MTSIQSMVSAMPRRYSSQSGVALIGIQAGATGADSQPVAEKT